MNARGTKEQLQRELKRIFRGLDFISKQLDREGRTRANQRLYFDVYQGLGLAWEFLGLQCKHWVGYRRNRDGQRVCRICGKIKGVQDQYWLLTSNGKKKIGERAVPRSTRVFASKNKAQILHDQIAFHGAILDVDIHNSYKSRLFGKGREISIAADRIVTLKEDAITCSVDEHVIDIDIEQPRGKTQKPRYGDFPWEISKAKLKFFPVIFRFDDRYRFLGLTILRTRKESRR